MAASPRNATCSLSRGSWSYSLLKMFRVAEPSRFCVLTESHTPPIVFTGKMDLHSQTDHAAAPSPPASAMTIGRTNS